jgi:hypothetical protein
MVFAAKGTNPKSVSDLKSDLKLTAKPIQRWDEIPRMRNSLGKYRELKNEYASQGIEHFSATGYSLGGGVALHIAKNTGDQAVVLNPALQATRARDSVSIRNSRIIRTDYDMVSRGRTAILDGERLPVLVSDGVRHPLSAHKMDQFIDAPFPNTPSLLDKASTMYDEHAPKTIGALTTASTATQLVGDIQDLDLGAFAKHATEAAISIKAATSMLNM